MAPVNVYNLILEELTASGACHVDRFPPFFIMSIGAHMFNLHNKSHHIYVVNRRTPDTRLHVLMCAPPGAEKTFWQEQFLRGDQALLHNSDLDVGFMGTITEAGFVGTIKFEAGEKKEVMGVCKTRETAIIGSEEFSAVTESMKAEYAKTLDSAMLGALDSGWVYKNLGAGELNYQTGLTLWAATQPARFDLRGGMGRRFLFIYFIPTAKDWADIRWAMRNGMNKAYNPIRTDMIRKEIAELKQKVACIQTIRVDAEKVYPFFDNLRILPYEENLYMRMIIGYTIMSGKFDHELYLTLDDVLKKFIKKETYYRDAIRRGTEFAEVISVLRDHGGVMSLVQLRDELVAFGKDWTQSAQLIEILFRTKAIKRVEGGNVELSNELRMMNGSE